MKSKNIYEKTGNQGLMQDSKKEKKEKKYHGKFYVCVIFIILALEYYNYVVEIMANNITEKNYPLVVLLISIFHILLVMLVWAFLTTISTNPGEIPLYWGFYIGDDDYKRKRYCLICNAFKPERAHHCSVCNVCVLNMDHHCPWVDNCIGFYNRKFFMQLLFYVTTLVIYYDITGFYFMTQNLYAFIKGPKSYETIIHIFFVTGFYLALVVFAFIITIFLRFHIDLVKKNSTTIESLDVDHKADYEKFDLGDLENWMQVFGPDKLFWFLPILCKRGAPCGDGLNWKTKDSNTSDENIELGLVEKQNSKKDIMAPGNNFDTNFSSNEPKPMYSKAETKF